MSLAVMIVAGTDEITPPAPKYVPPATRAASFSPMPEMWGLREFSSRLQQQSPGVTT